MKYEETGKELTIGDVVIKSSITMTEISKLALWCNRQDKNDCQVRNKTNLFANKFFIDYAVGISCFRGFLLYNGYIKEKKEDKWCPDTGNWKKANDNIDTIGLFGVGVMVKRFHLKSGHTEIMQVTREPYWKKCVKTELLAIDTLCKSSISDTGYRDDNYYLSDLFSGDVYIKDD